MTEPETPNRYLLLAAGTDERWKGRDGPLTANPKHFAPLCGEPLIERIIRQIRERDDTAAIRIVVRDTDDDRYKIPGARRVTAKQLPDWGGLDRVLSARHAWNKTGRTIMVLADVYFTEAAADKVVGHSGEWTLFGRPGGSKLTGKKWGEPFALSFGPDDHDAIVAGAERSRTAQLEHNGKILPYGFPPWYRAMIPWIPDERLGDKWFWPPDTVKFGHYVAIEDATDDIDTPDEWDRWCWGYAQASDDERERLWH